MNLDKLVVQRCIRDRCEVENGVDLFVSELFMPIECGEVLGDEIAAIASEIFEIAGAEIVDHC